MEGSGIGLAQDITRVVCEPLKLPLGIVEEGLQSFQLPHGRLNRFQKEGITFIDDTYNANPLSMKLGLETLAKESTVRGRRVAVLGFMAELDVFTSHYHKEIGRYAKERANLLIGVGEGTQDYDPDYWFPTPAACAAELKKLLLPQDVVYIKGSQSSKMHLILGEF